MGGEGKFIDFLDDAGSADPLREAFEHAGVLLSDQSTGPSFVQSQIA